MRAGEGIDRELGGRAANYPAAGVNPSNPRQVVVTFASYINQDSNTIIDGSYAAQP